MTKLEAVPTGPPARRPAEVHDPLCGCADCRIARHQAEPTHRVVPGAPWGVTTACGIYVGREAQHALRLADPSETPTCSRCLLENP